MAPIKSSLAKSVGKLLGVQKDTDLSLRGDVQNSRFIEVPFVASGGTTTTFGSYKAHIFEHPNSDNFEVTEGSADIDILVVAGGGGGANGGSGQSGGGGAGAVIHETSFLSLIHI